MSSILRISSHSNWLFRSLFGLYLTNVCLLVRRRQQQGCFVCGLVKRGGGGRCTLLLHTYQISGSLFCPVIRHMIHAEAVNEAGHLLSLGHTVLFSRVVCVDIHGKEEDGTIRLFKRHYYIHEIHSSSPDARSCLRCQLKDKPTKMTKCDFTFQNFVHCSDLCKALQGVIVSKLFNNIIVLYALLSLDLQKSLAFL